MICLPCAAGRHHYCNAPPTCPCAHQAPQTPPSPEDGATTQPTPITESRTSA